MSRISEYENESGIRVRTTFEALGGVYKVNVRILDEEREAVLDLEADERHTTQAAYHEVRDKTKVLLRDHFGEVVSPTRAERVSLEATDALAYDVDDHVEDRVERMKDLEEA